MKPLASKKGIHLLWNTIINIIIVVTASVLFIVLATQLHSNSRILVKHYANDIASIMESVQAVPGDVSLNYPLADGFIVKLEEDKVIVTYPEEKNEAEVLFHHLKGITIKEGREENRLYITKKDNIISIEPPFKTPVQDKQCPQPVTLGTISLSTSIKTPEIANTITTDDLLGIKNTFDYRTKQFDKGDETLYLTITSSPSQEPYPLITVKRPHETDIRENNYQYLFCALIEALEDTPFAFKETLTQEDTPDYEIELIFSTNDVDRKTLLVKKADIAKAFTESFALLQPEVTP